MLSALLADLPVQRRRRAAESSPAGTSKCSFLRVGLSSPQQQIRMSVRPGLVSFWAQQDDGRAARLVWPWFHMGDLN